MDLLTFLHNEMDQHRQKAREITDLADKEGRGVSEPERRVVTESLERMKEIQAKINDERDKEQLRALVDGWDAVKMNGGTDPNPVQDESIFKARGQSMGDAFVNSPVFKMLQAKYKENGGLPQNSETPPVQILDWRAKVAGDPVLESDSVSMFGTGGNAGAFTTLAPIQPPLQVPLTIADLIPSIPITVGNSATWPVVTTRTRASTASVVEGTAKPGAEYVFDIDSAVLLTKAAWVKVSTQFLEDAPGLAAYINADLPYMVRETEEEYLAAGLYGGSPLSVNGSQLDLAGTENAFDAIQEAIAMIRVNGGRADAMIIDPFDWANLLTVKWGPPTGQTGYVGGGPFTPTSNPWGLRVVVSDAATQGLPIVGDFARGAKVYRRGGLNVRTTNADGTDFIKNLVTILAEMRLVLGISYENLFVTAVIGTS
jgi:HK97 family phage major capsid protein